jgi:hypothetical protein
MVLPSLVADGGPAPDPEGEFEDLNERLLDDPGVGTGETDCGISGDVERYLGCN